MKPAMERNVAHNLILFIQSLEDHFVTNNTSLEKEKVQRTEFGTLLVAGLCRGEKCLNGNLHRT